MPFRWSLLFRSSSSQVSLVQDHSFSKDFDYYSNFFQLAFSSTIQFTSTGSLVLDMVLDGLHYVWMWVTHSLLYTELHIVFFIQTPLFRYWPAFYSFLDMVSVTKSASLQKNAFESKTALICNLTQLYQQYTYYKSSTTATKPWQKGVAVFK